MEAKLYNINNFSYRKLFYMLDNITDESVKLFRRTPAGDEEFTQYDLHRMDNGRLLIAFYDYWMNSTIHSLVAKCDDTEEFVNMQPFERIMPYWNPSLDYANPEGNKGIFVFFNSIPIYADPNDWRCDNTFYGPQRYVTSEDEVIYPVPTPEEIVIYEPIINIHGLASLTYLSNSANAERLQFKNHIVNEDVIPSATITLSEMFRLLTEWAALAEEPFNSTQPITLDAKGFLDKIGFNSILVKDQTNMQVAQYLLGNTNARRRPDDVVETNEYLLNFIKRKMAHMSLASLMSCYPEYGKIDAEIQFDIESADQEFADNLIAIRIEGAFTLDNYEDALELLPPHLTNARSVFKLRWDVLKKKKDLALALQTP